MSNGPESAERRIFGSRELTEVGRYSAARYTINEGLKMLRKAPEFKKALLDSYLDGSVESKRKLAEGEVTFQKGDSVWTSKFQKSKNEYGLFVQFRLIKNPPTLPTESGEIEEAVAASILFSDRGEITCPAASVTYTQAFTPDMASSSNLLLDNMP